MKYGSPYIDLNRLEKNFRIIFLHFAQCHFICTFFRIIFRFSLFSGQLLRSWLIVPTANLNRAKNGLFELFAKKYGFSVFKTKFRSSMFNTKYGLKRTKYGVFLLKIRKSVCRLKPFRKKL